MPKIRRAATKREHRKVPTSPPPSSTDRRNAAAAAALKVKPLSAKRAAREAREAAQTQAAVRRLLGSRRSRRSAPKVPTLTAKGETTGPSWSPGDPLAAAVEQDVIAPLQREGKLPKKKTVGQEIYGKIAEWGPSVLTFTPEIKAGATALKAALAGAESGGVTVGGSRALSRVLTPAKATSAEARAAVAARAEEKAARASASGVKAVAKRSARRVARTEQRADRAVARSVAGTPTRREVAAAAGAPLKVAKAGSAQTLPVVQGHERALVEHPGKVAKTTARALPGLVTVPVGQAAGLGVAGGRAVSAGLHAAGVPGFRGYSGEEIAAPVVEMGQEQLDFAKQVARTVTSSDSAEVQKEVEDNLGLLLPIMLGLGTKAAVSKVTKGRVTEAVRRIAENARARAGRGRDRHNGQTPRVFENSGQRKAEARRAARHRTRSERERRDRTESILKAARKAGGSEVVRRGVGGRQGFRGRPADLEVSGRDVLSFAVRHSLPLDKPREALAEVKRIKGTIKPLPEGMTLPADSLSTRDVIAFIERNPHVLADKNLARGVAAYNRQARHARETPGLSPEHSERARFTSTAVTRGVPLSEERFPLSVRDEVRATPTPGRAAKDVLRREAKSDRQRGKRLDRRASTREARARLMKREAAIRASQVEPRMAIERNRVDRIKRLEARRESIGAKRQALRDRGSTSKLMTQYRRALGQIDKELEQLRTAPASASRLQRERVERRAAGMEAVGRKQRQLAADSRETAKRKQKASYEIDPAVNAEFIEEMRTRLAAEGKPEPEYVHTGKAREAPTYGATGAKLTQFPGKSKFRKGSAEAYGLVREDLPTTLRESIARPISRRESYAAMRSFLADNEYRASESGRPDKSEFTSDEARALFEGGVISRDNYVLVPRQLYARAYGKFDPQQAAAGLRLALDGEELPGRKFKIVRRAAATEFFDQLTASFSPKLAKINQATSTLILKTSPAWAAMQVVAEYAQGAVAQPKLLNPAFVRRAIREYKLMTPHERQHFDSWVGVTTRALESPDDLRLELGAGDMAAASDAIKAMDRTPLGKLITAIPRGIGKLDEMKGGRIRMLVVAAKLDSEANGRRYMELLGGIRGLHKEISQASAEMKGKPLSEQMAYMASRPELANRFVDYLDNVMGNWSALTKRERTAAGVMIFYPFMRMATRWTFYAFPKEHPVRAALLYYLGQQNANELKKMLGQDPSFFTGWATVPLHFGDGETQLIPLSRIAPGLGPATELLGEAVGSGDPGVISTQALRAVQPAIAAAITGVTGVSPLSGKQEADRAAAALAQLISLPAPVRVADELLTPGGEKKTEAALPLVGPLFGSTERQQALDKLFARLGEKRTPARLVRSLAVPPIPRPVAYERDLARLRSILDTISENSSGKRQDLEAAWAYEGRGGNRRQIDRRLAGMERAYDRAQKGLDQLFAKYQIPYKAEEAKGSQRYAEIHYGAKPPMPTMIGGLQVQGAPKSKAPSSGGGVTTIAGVPVGANPASKTEPRFYRPKQRVTTIAGVPIP